MIQAHKLGKECRHIVQHVKARWHVGVVKQARKRWAKAVVATGCFSRRSLHAYDASRTDLG